MNVEIQGCSALVGPVRASSTDERTAGSPATTTSPPGAPPVPQSEVPGTAAALPVAEAALRRVLAAQGSSHAPGDTAAIAVDLLRNVEALLRATAPAGLSVEDLGAAAARLVERQGLLARLAEAPSMTSGPWPGAEATEDVGPASVDTRL